MKTEFTLHSKVCNKTKNSFVNFSYCSNSVRCDEAKCASKALFEQSELFVDIFMSITSGVKIVNAKNQG